MIKIHVNFLSYNIFITNFKTCIQIICIQYLCIQNKDLFSLEEYKINRRSKLNLF